MTSCDKRLEELLNREGQTISDLPKAYTMREHEELKRVLNMATQWFAQEDYPDRVRVDLATVPLFQYILHLTDIIDRMETALENVCGQRDYLTAKYAPGPYEPVPEDWKIPEEMDDALALLKAQEPRVLTLKELKEGEAYYMDEKGSYNYDVLLISIEKDATEPFMIFNFNPVCEGVGLNIRDYGKDWRCWSSKPTDEQREAVPWGE